MPGEPRWMQRYKIKRAKKRRKIARWVRCKIGWHNPPWNQPFEEFGSLFLGGPCTYCDDEVWNVVTYIGDVWDFPSGISQEEGTTAVHDGHMTDVIITYLQDDLKV